MNKDKRDGDVKPNDTIQVYGCKRQICTVLINYLV